MVNSEVKVGQTVYFVLSYANPYQIVEGKVKTVYVDTVLIELITFPGSTVMPISDLHTDFTSAYSKLKEKEQRLIGSYVAEINTVEDLVRFMFNHVVSNAEEYTEWEAREAARNKAIQLLGIEL